MNLSLWRDAALILLTLEVFIALLPVLAVTYFCLKGVLGLTRWLRHALPRAQSTMLSIQKTTNRLANSLAAPVMAGYTLVATGKGLARGTLSVVRGK